MRILILAAAVAAAGVVPSAASTGMAAGDYECWYFSDARLTFNFSVSGPGAYTGYDGSAGTYALDPSTGEVVFASGTLAGAMPDGFKAVYEVREGIPTLSYISPRGAEALFCQNT